MARSSFLFFASLLLAPAAGGGAEAASKPSSSGPATTGRLPFRQALQPFLEKHCTGCHGGEKPKAGISFERRGEVPSVQQDARTWEKALAALRTRKMPPKSRPAPEASELLSAIAWLEAEFAALDCGGPPDPGRPTIRRLNRSEYNNTIGDLLAMDFQPADDFPSDDLGYGFDNIGDVLSLPPLLMEKYLLAAEKIVERALVVDPITQPVLTRYEADFLKATGPTGPAAKKAVVLLPGAEIRAKPEITEDGDYVLRVRAAGRKGGAEPIRLALKVDGKEV